ncbi:transglycosylase domain-containing protein [Bacillus tuaregi]|uniref:transglycosylase domain-containing protein n=1 Tax=Bacillus tuaregi TaxID=1816695 RepID=UPI0008F82AF3|nr:penicillin-binding protein 1A [Bacillus tuaregi]
MTEKYQSREERRKQQEAAKNKHSKKKKPKGSIFKRVFLILVALGIIGIIGGAATFAFMVKDAPKLDADTLKAAIPSEIYDTEGKPITEIGTQKLEYVEYEDIPELVRDAVIATEDSRFFKHHGVDPIRLGGAVIANFTNGFGSEGASTITQQVVKNYFLTADKTLSRKAQEAWLSIQLERKYTKEEIFELYVNKVFMSERITGIATASQVYFGKPLNELTLPEAALLAGMPQSPNNYNPFNYPDKAEKRRNIVLSLMNQHGYISESEMKEAQAASVTDSLEEERAQQGDIPYDSFIGQVIKEIEEKYPELNVYTDGLKIYTTLDTKAQNYVDQIMYENDIVPFPDEKFQAGITLLDTKTGEIRALGGSRNKDIDFGLNYATSVPRQPGSTIKPILDYGPAIEFLKWGTYETIVDEPYKYSTGQTINNWDHSHMGPLSMREALARSRNVPALKALQEVGLERAHEFANNLGLNLEEMVESNAIGGLKNGVTSLQMAGAYSAFANNGYYTEPHSVKEIEFRDGTKINMAPKSEAVMSDYTAFMISDMLKSVVSSPYGTGQKANVSGLPVAGKTGTTNYSTDEMKKFGITASGAVPDAWFVGYTTNYTTAVWTGYEERKNAILPGKDQRIAMEIFSKLMKYVSEDKKTADFTVPKSVQKVRVEKGSRPAKLASEYTPDSQVIYEYAVKGNAPSTVSNKFKKLTGPSDLSAVYDSETNEIVLSWSHGEDEDTQYQVSVSLNGGAEQALSTTSESGLRMSNPQSGGTYTFKVIAVRDEQTSNPATTSVTIPTEEQENDEETDEGRNENNNEENPGNNPGNPNNNNGNPGGNNGNGRPGNNNGSGNGNNQTNPGHTQPDDDVEDVDSSNEQPQTGAQDHNSTTPQQ